MYSNLTGMSLTWKNWPAIGHIFANLSRIILQTGKVLLRVNLAGEDLTVVVRFQIGDDFIHGVLEGGVFAWGRLTGGVLREVDFVGQDLPYEYLVRKGRFDLRAILLLARVCDLVKHWYVGLGGRECRGHWPEVGQEAFLDKAEDAD
jgi:hypothetical protein